MHFEPNTMIEPDSTFERATSDGLHRVLPLVRAYYEFDGIAFQRERVQAALETLLRDSSLGLVWIVRSQANDVGYVILTFGFDLEFGGSTATITELYILPAYRRSGFGARAMERLEGLCRELGVRCLELQVERDNLQAQAFYRKLGFAAHNRIPLTKELR